MISDGVAVKQRVGQREGDMIEINTNRDRFEEDRLKIMMIYDHDGVS